MADVRRGQERESMTEKKWEMKEENQEVQIHSMRDSTEKKLADSPDLKRQEPEDQPTFFPEEIRRGLLKMSVQKKLSLLLIPFSLLLIAVLAALNITTVYEFPLVLPVTNTLFIGVISLGIAYITTRVYNRSGTASVFLIGSGILIFGLGAITAGWLILLPGGPNINVTIYNTCAFIGSLFILTGAVISCLVPNQKRGSGSTWKGATIYTGILVFVTLFCLATIDGLIPPFFIPGIGFTVIRQVLLENAIVFYAIASVLFLYTYLKGRTDFFFWYSVSFALLSIGLFAFFIQPTVGSLMGWVGRSANYIGFLFALYAVYIAQRAATAKNLPLEEIIANFFVDAEQSYKQLVETATDAIITFDEDYRVLLWNPAAERMFGYRRDEVIGISFPELVIDERYIAFIKNDNEGITSSQPQAPLSVEIVSNRKDGTLIPVELTISRRWQNGRLIRTGILRDLTERKVAEEALYMSLVIDGVPTQLSYVDADLRYVYVNKAYAEWYGKTINELKGKNISDVIGEEIFLQDLPHYQMALSGKPVSFERIMPDTEGKEHFVIISLVPHYKDERVTGFFASIIDITERKRAEDALQLKDFAIESSINAIAIADLSGNLTNVNPAFLSIWGYEHRQEVLGRSVLSFWKVPDEAQQVVDGIQAQGTWSGEMTGQRKDGTPIPVQLSANLIRDVAGTPVAMMGSFIDITERKRVEDTLFKINQKLNILSQLTRKDLTSQIFILNSYLELAKKQAAGQDQVLSIIQKGKRAAESINEITEITKDYQDMGSKLPTWQNVKMALLFGLSHITAGDIRHSLEIEHLEIFADPLLEKACQGLFENSMAHGGQVTRIRVWHTVTPDGVTIVFEDDGIGIPQEKKESIFLRSDGAHTSVRGLFFVREILDITGIAITETGEPGKGARFEMTVPKSCYQMKRE
jgi:PAS domain S-box-containing protein